MAYFVWKIEDAFPEGSATGKSNFRTLLYLKKRENRGGAEGNRLERTKKTTNTLI